MQTLNLHIQDIINKAEKTRIGIMNTHAEKGIPMITYNPLECKVGEVILEWADGRKVITNQRPTLNGNQHCF